MLDELWMEVRDIVQEAVIKIISKKKKMQKGKMVVWEGLTNSWGEKKKTWKAKEERKDITIWMQSSKEEQGEITQPSLVVSAKK